MKHFVIFLLFAASLLSCSKSVALPELTGTVWGAYNTTQQGQPYVQTIAFTAESFTITMTFPSTPSYPPSVETGTYRYEYPKIHFTCSSFTDTGEIASDCQSFTMGNSVFIKK